MGDEASGRELVAPLLALEPEISTLATMPAAGLMRLHADPEGNTPGVGDGAMLASLPDEAIAAVLAAGGPGSGSPFISLELRQLGGALGRPAERAGAASHLEAGFGMFAVGLPFTPEMRAAIEAHLDVVARRRRAVAQRAELLQLRGAPRRERDLLHRLHARPPARDPRALRPDRPVPGQPAHPARRLRLVGDPRKQSAAGADERAGGVSLRRDAL